MGFFDSLFGGGGQQTKIYPFDKFLPKELRGKAKAAAAGNLDLLGRIAAEGETPEEGLMFRGGRNQTILDMERLSQRIGANLSATGASSSSYADTRRRGLQSYLLNALTLMDAQRAADLKRKQVEASNMQIANIGNLAGRGQAVTTETAPSPLAGILGTVAGGMLGGPVGAALGGMADSLGKSTGGMSGLEGMSSKTSGFSGTKVSY